MNNSRTITMHQPFRIPWKSIFVILCLVIVLSVPVLLARVKGITDLNTHPPRLYDSPPAHWTWKNAAGTVTVTGNGCDFRTEDAEKKGMYYPFVLCKSWKEMLPDILAYQVAATDEQQSSTLAEFIRFLTGGNMPPPALP